MKKTKIFSTLMATAFAFLFAVSPVNASSEEAKENTKENETLDVADGTEVVFWHAMNAEQGKELEKLTKDFMKKYPNVKITLQNQTDYGSLSQKLVATSQSPKDLPTITQAYPNWLYDMISHDMVVDLTDKVKTDITDWDLVVEGLRNGVTIDSKVYGIPFNKSTEVIWYNKDVFDKAGVEVPKTFEELKEVSKKITEKTGMVACGFDSLTNFFEAYLNSKGIAFDEKVDFSSPEVLEAVNYYIDGIKEGYFRIAGTDKYLSGPMSNEQLAMYIGSNAGETYVKEGAEGKFDYEVAPYPSESSIQQGTDLYMFSNATEDQQKAALAYMNFLISKDNQIEWGIKTGYIPVKTSAIEDEKYTKSDSKIAGVLKDATKSLFSAPVKKGSQQAYNDVGSMLEQLLSNPKNDVEKTLKDFQSTYDSAWK
ncbi:MAG: ABC transporter substrate-binding protein [Peptoniphilaceae bacterium]|nr:ABC transporter substrate-binding protein [Peptoniphilaceae bacterium]MDD7383713.1 ABC transporter substrate-binding protein [Peptoniphilaceae bacterium]MDY3737888.1 ABC transporter substrate-binding protein [Peptoniphilaceae bacterium]